MLIPEVTHWADDASAFSDATPGMSAQGCKNV